MSTYSAAELADFIKEGAVRLQDVARLKNLSLFSDEELMTFITSGAATFAEIQRCGLHYKRQEAMREKLAVFDIEREFYDNAVAQGTTSALREYLEAFPSGLMRDDAQRRLTEAEEVEVYATAEVEDNISLYEHYLATYPDGRYRVQAESRLRELHAERDTLQGAIFSDMRQNPWKYTPVMMRALFEGPDKYAGPVDTSSLPQDDVAARFLARGLTLTYQELVDNGVVPPQISRREMTAPEFELPQINSFDAFPQDRTDIYFLGVPRSGKSSVLAGLFNAMDTNGNWEYVPNIDAEGRDSSLAYYNGLIKAIHAKKPPFPTAHDTINYINIDVPHAAGTRGTATLNFVEISGECFRNLANSLGDGKDMWNQLGASRVLANNNRKVLFFLLDYNVILGHQDGISLYDQQEALKNALIILSHDGSGANHKKGCTLSKVDSVGVILTKADLMNTPDRRERTKIAVDYLNTNFRSFMNILTKACQDFNINRADKNAPYIMTFSLGQFYPGNTMLFDPADSLELAANIESLVSTHH